MKLKNQNSRSKISLLIFMLCAVFAGCNGSLDSDKCLQSVREIFPRSKIYSKPGSISEFIVIDSSGIKKVKTMNCTNAEISDIEALIER